MVGYVLKNTMVNPGSVSRAICTVEDDYLVSMRENKRIEFVGDKIISHIDDKEVELTGNEWVSMNFFGFTPLAFDSFTKYWDSFIKENINTKKEESLLPESANEIARNKEGKIKLYTTQEKWFGMTYSEDREIVKNELAKKMTEGYYPEKLWEK